MTKMLSNNPGFFFAKNKQLEATTVKKMLTGGPIVALLIKHNVCTQVGELGGKCFIGSTKFDKTFHTTGIPQFLQFQFLRFSI